MDQEYGLPSLEEQSIELCLTDPEFNVGYKKKKAMKNTQAYIDNRKNYAEWCATWFKELERICQTIIIHPGKVNFDIWYGIKPAYDWFCAYPQGTTPSYGKATWIISLDPYICYGKFGKKRLSNDVFTYPFKNTYKFKYIHPCPLDNTIIEKIITQMAPESLIDPFLGSGTTAEVCEKLGIQWLGYEIEEKFSVDIDKRIKTVHQQKGLDKWLKNH